MYCDSHAQNSSNINKQLNIDRVIHSSRYDNQVCYLPQQKYQGNYKPLILNPMPDSRRQINNNFNQLNQQFQFKQTPAINFVNSNQKDYNSPYQQAYIGSTVLNPAYIKKNQFFKSRQTINNLNDNFKSRPNFSPNPKDDFQIKKHYIRSTIDLKPNKQNTSYTTYNVSNTSIGQKFKELQDHKLKKYQSQIQNRTESQYSSNSPFTYQESHHLTQVKKNNNNFFNTHYDECQLKQKKQNIFDLNYQSQFQCSQLKKNQYKFSTPLNNKTVLQVQLKNEYSGIKPGQIKTVTELQYKGYQDPLLNRSTSSYFQSNDIKSKFQKTLQNSKLLRKQSYASLQVNNGKAKGSKEPNKLNQEEQKDKQKQKVISELKQIKDQYRNMKQKNQHLQKIIQNKSHTIQQLQKWIEQIKKRQIGIDQSDLLLHKLKEKTTFIQTLQEELNKQKITLDEKRKLLTQLSNNYQQTQKLRSIHQAKSKLLQQKLNNFQKQKNIQVQKLQQELKIRKKQIMNKSSQFEKISQKNAVLQKQFQKHLRMTHDSTQKLENQIKCLQIQNNQLVITVKSIEQQRQHRKIQFNEMNKEIQNLKQQKKVLMQINSSLQLVNADLSHKNQYFQNKLSKLQRQLQNKQQKIQNLQKINAKNTSYQQSASIKQKVIQQELDYLKQKLSTKDAACSSLQEQLSKKTKQIEILIFQKGELQSKIQKSNLKLKQAVNTQKNNKTLQDYRQKISNFQQQRTEYLKKITMLNQIIVSRQLKEKQLKQKILLTQNENQIIVQKYQEQLDLLIQQKNIIKLKSIQKQPVYETLQNNQTLLVQKENLLQQYHQKYFQIASYFNLQNFDHQTENQPITQFTYQKINQQIKTQSENTTSLKLNKIHKQLKQQIQRIHKDLKKLVLVLKDNESEHQKMTLKMYDADKNIKKISMKMGQIHAQLHLKNILIQQINKRIIQKQLTSLDQKYKNICNYNNED